MPSQFLKQSKNTQRVDMPAGNLAGRIEAGRPLETPAPIRARLAAASVNLCWRISSFRQCRT
jgi:hypothetical protein